MRAEHAEELIAASTGHGLFRLFPTSLETSAQMRAFLDYALAELAAGTRLPFTTVERRTGRIVGSTSYLAIERASTSDWRSAATCASCRPFRLVGGHSTPKLPRRAR